MNGVEMDSLDVRLLTLLEMDAKRSYTEIAAELGVSPPTVQSRLQRLLDAGAVRIICWADHVALGYASEVTLALNAYPDRLREAEERLRACTAIRYLVLCTGRFDMIAEAMFRSREELSRFLLEELRVIPGLARVETLLRLRHVKLSTHLLTDGRDSRPAEKPRPDLDAVDRALMARLQDDARQTPAELAANLGVSESTVRRRLQRLLNEHIVRIVGVANAFALGYQAVASIGLKVSPGNIRAAAEALAAYRHIRTVGIYAGRYDLMAWGLFRELGDLDRFLSEELSTLPGLKDAEIMPHIRIAKASHRFSTE